MTSQSMITRYTKLLGGTESIESSLHNSLEEYLNAEIVLSTIKDIASAIIWLKQTYFYIRARSCPEKYGLVMTDGSGLEMALQKLGQAVIGDDGSVTDTSQAKKVTALGLFPQSTPEPK
ncbi:hypothetical protein CYMTET_35566 [Cymbomonas tetramitiformis]|uniref:DNA 3'-5' helicase n=1 Tax=Cymbomonas tetramitiformis TaxID=36881 RepID=A0AAE0KNQ2_9CHLO|nr:hypothetical protein CYMTET_35566 [Cymbomonas tetramitiformis]